MRHLPSFVRTAEAQALLGAATKSRDKLIVQVGLLMGLRVSEICKLEVPDLDLAEGRAFIRQGKGDKDRYVPIPRRLVELLSVWLAGRQVGYLFPSPRGGKLCTRTVQLLLKRLAKRAGLPECDKARKYTPHKLRHRYATDVLKKVGNIRVVQRLLGHSSVATTEIYTHVEDEDLKNAVDDM